MKVLFLVLHRKNRSPGQRYRHEQYIQFLEENGVQCHFSPLLTTPKEDEIFYENRIVPKVFVGLKALLRRWKSVLSMQGYDSIYIYRDAFFFGTFFEKQIKKRNIPIIYDFDDAIWLMDKNENQGVFNKLKNPSKTKTICMLAKKVIVGNNYLADYAKQFNQNVTVIPSTIDFSTYRAEKRHKSKKICIGWTGSFSTIKHFETILTSLLSVQKKYQGKVYFKLIGDPTYSNEALGVEGIPWNANTEPEDLSELDIGLMPLPNNEWTQGKCGMKGLQYMALGIPTIMSPVGVNNDIIRDGENGFLAATEEEWVEKLSLLIEDASLRKKLGEAGRKTVKQHYSVEANKEKWLEVFNPLS